MPAFNGWSHCMSNTYGTWLPGDPRGFRTRKHREHVEGDYKSPPPKGSYDHRHEAARQSLSCDPVYLSVDARRACVEALVYAWIEVHQIEVLSIAVGSCHLHVLARFQKEIDISKPTPSRGGLREKDPARYYVGIGKERSAKALAAVGLVKPGGIWAKRGKIVPIKDRQHQLNVFQYILDHEQEGAAVWSFRDKE